MLFQHSVFQADPNISSCFFHQIYYIHCISPPPEVQVSLVDDTGRIRLFVSTVNRTYEFSGITHVTLFPKYGKHSTGPSAYGPWVRTYSKSFSCKPVLTVCSYRAQSNEIFTYGEVSRGSVPRVRRYGLLYLRAVEYDHYQVLLADEETKKKSTGILFSICTISMSRGQV